MITQAPDASVVPHVVVPEIPTIGRSEAHYIHEAHVAERAGDRHAYEAWKAAQYITLGLDSKLKWPAKLKCFQHALHRHCNPPQVAERHVWDFYDKLADLVREHCGREALRLANAEDEVLAKWQKLGHPKEMIDAKAQEFFDSLLSRAGHCPEHFNEEDWLQLTLFRDAWV